MIGYRGIGHGHRRPTHQTPPRNRSGDLKAAMKQSPPLNCPALLQYPCLPCEANRNPSSKANCRSWKSSSRSLFSHEIVATVGSGVLLYALSPGVRISVRQSKVPCRRCWRAHRVITTPNAIFAKSRKPMGSRRGRESCWRWRWREAGGGEDETV
jgi:hypothetical protein